MAENLTELATRHQVYLEKLKTSEANDYTKVLPELDKRIREILAVLTPELTEVKKSELDAVLRKLTTAQQKMLAANDKAFYKELQEIAGYEASFEARTITSLVEVGLAVPTAEAAFKAALNTPLSATGTLLAPFIESWSANHIDKVNNAVRKAWTDGQTVGDLVRTIRGTRKNNFRDGILETSRRNAVAVARTAVQEVSSASRNLLWERNNDIIVAYKFVATLDGRTSQICRSLDGREFPLGKGPKPPVHVNCRSTTVPVLDKKYEALNEGGTRASKDGYVSANLTYYEWLKRQPVAFQKKVLGKGKYDIFKSDGMTAEKFAKLNLDKDFSPITLAELKVAEATTVTKPAVTTKPSSVSVRQQVEEKYKGYGLSSNQINYITKYEEAVKSGDSAAIKLQATNLRKMGIKVDGRAQKVVMSPAAISESSPANNMRLTDLDKPSKPRYAEQYGQWKSSLTAEEKSGIDYWSSDVYAVGDIREYQSTGKAQNLAKAKAFTEAIKKAPKYQGTVYRGQGFDGDLNSLKVGQKYSFGHIVSTSKNLDVGEEFASYAFNNPVLFEIRTKSGVDISTLVTEEYLDQAEVVLPKGVNFRITDVIDEDGYKKVVLGDD